MKKVCMILCIITICLLFACSTAEPKLLYGLESQSISYKKASKYDWETEKIDDKYAYIIFEYDDKQYFRLYKDKKEIYEYTFDINISLVEMESCINKDGVLYFYMDIMFKGDKPLVYALISFKDNQMGLIEKWYTHNIDIFFTKYIYVCLGNEKNKVLKYDYQGTLLGQYNLNLDAFMVKMYDIENGFMFVCIVKHSSLGEIIMKYENDSLELLCETKYGLISRNMDCNLEYKNGVLTFYGVHWEENKCTYYKYVNGVENVLFTLNIPDDFHYNIDDYVVDGHILLFVDITKKSDFKVYWRKVILHYDGSKLRYIFFDKHAEKITYDNENIYIGNYSNFTSNKTHNGTFYKFNILEIING